MMMSSTLGAVTAAHLLSESYLGGDLGNCHDNKKNKEIETFPFFFFSLHTKDGGLWVDESSEKFKGGFEWVLPGYIRFSNKLITGLGVEKKK